MTAQQAQANDNEIIGHYINGEIIVESDRLAPVMNPATGEVARHIALASRKSVEVAIGAAETAFPAWSSTPPVKRARVIFKFKELCEANADKLCEIITAEHGKVLSDARGELTRGLEIVEFACGIPHLLKGEHSENVGNRG